MTTLQLIGAMLLGAMIGGWPFMWLLDRLDQNVAARQAVA